MFIEEEINLLIQLKYNFIHWNGFPDVHKINYDNPKFKKNPTPTQKLAQDLAEKYHLKWRKIYLSYLLLKIM